MRTLPTTLIAISIAACGPAVHTSWVEHESPLGQSSATSRPVEGTEPAHPQVDVSKIDVGKLDAAAIDALDEATVLTLLERLHDAAPSARLALRAARLAYHRGDSDEARELLVRASTAADEPSVHGELTALAPLVADHVVQRDTVAVLLPLSGRFSALGRELRAAIELAPANGTKWLFLDTQGDAAGAVAAVEQANAKGAIAILGPVGQREALAAARAATLDRLPIALLAPADGAEPSAGVFRLVDSPADEGRAAARLAKTEGFPTVGVFAPRDDIAAETAEAFVAEAQALGIAVTANGSYDPTSGSVETDVRAFLDLNPATNPRFAEHLRKAGKKGWTTFTPDVPYSLLFIPDRYDRAAIVSAFLPYYGVELRTQEFPDADMLMRKHGGVMPQVVQLLGGAGWNHPTLPTVGGSAVQGALIVDVFSPDNGGDTAAQFASEFQQRVGATAGSVAAQVFDAATLVANARAQAAVAPDPRSAMRAAISRAKLDDGACGPAAMDVDGELKRESITLEVDSGQLIVAP
ncbi:MAG TPA: penicillin-binding protein activator [Kofleriaceae bacterium]